MRKNLKKVMKTVLVSAMALSMTCAMGCGSKDDNTSKKEDQKTEANGGNAGAQTGNITVVSREDGSGTRGAFIELFEIEAKGADGKKEDKTTTEAVIANNTNVMMTNVSGDDKAIGYSSLGSLNSDVKALKVDGVEPTSENVASGTYKIARPFNIVTKDGLSDAAKDFMNYILSKEGQEVVGGTYVKALDDAKSYEATDASGKVVVTGSSSVSPIMEKLVEAYGKINSKVTIEVNTIDSTAGVQNTIDGTCDIGMASRELKDTETGVTATKIAIDGIAIIVNNNNSISDISKDNVTKIYTGETTTWDAVK